jgi:5-methylcytosine-specific restriction enzyme A
MKKACRYCGQIHEHNYICPKKPVRNKRPTKYDKFRGSREWQRKRAAIVQRDLHLCQVCMQQGIYNSAVEVHHIVPLSEDFNKRLDDNNLICLCHKHHEDAEAGVIPRDRLTPGPPPVSLAPIF